MGIRCFFFFLFVFLLLVELSLCIIYRQAFTKPSNLVRIINITWSHHHPFFFSKGVCSKTEELFEAKSSFRCYKRSKQNPNAGQNMLTRSHAI